MAKLFENIAPKMVNKKDIDIARDMLKIYNELHDERGLEPYAIFSYLKKSTDPKYHAVVDILRRAGEVSNTILSAIFKVERLGYERYASFVVVAAMSQKIRKGLYYSKHDMGLILQDLGLSVPASAENKLIEQGIVQIKGELFCLRKGVYIFISSLLPSRQVLCDIWGRHIELEKRVAVYLKKVKQASIQDLKREFDRGGDLDIVIEALKDRGVIITPQPEVYRIID